ncbi:6-phospho-5-dehydro-2-deoxy-D-gluconate aldolase [Frankliniella fusca]|uniref:6-phospho-5-dehydro-2-deoxy-D-gluconate aldolase n=1 Tax=Frankliniella fusca TaxID=407009 RepID=A0AAE1GS24_9NEOP|nr:6-phospho-5-dehydro-2-deoxy-D-gluconate aldolase [Frankliniella fusca]
MPRLSSKGQGEWILEPLECGRRFDHHKEQTRTNHASVSLNRQCSIGWIEKSKPPHRTYA